jgi:Protein of unknown function (DUF3386)
MNPRRWMVWGLATCLLFGGAEAGAHALFVRVGPLAEGGRSAEVTFGERPGVAEPKFVPKIASTRLWLQAAPGEFRPIEVRKGVDRLRAHVPGSGAITVVGECEYGVFAPKGSPPTLLRYYPKALAGDASGLNAMKPREGTPAEIAAEFDGDKVRLVALRHGKPAPAIVFEALDPDGGQATVSADPQGRATVTPTAPGHLTFYARFEEKAAGDREGKPYETVTHVATLSFDWPIVPGKADPEALALFDDAVAARAQWKEFPGFTARIEGTFEGRPFTGSVELNAAGKATAKLDEPVPTEWVEGQLVSVATHRFPPRPDERQSLRFADEAGEHPLGRLLVSDDLESPSSYRIKDRQIRQVNRLMGPHMTTILTLNNGENPEGKSLPGGYVVQTWKDSTGELHQAVSVRYEWTRVGRFDLPASLLTARAADAGQSIRAFTLTGHKLTQPE